MSTPIFGLEDEGEPTEDPLKWACPECGTEVGDDDDICPGCGAEFIDDDEIEEADIATVVATPAQTAVVAETEIGTLDDTMAYLAEMIEKQTGLMERLIDVIEDNTAAQRGKNTRRKPSESSSKQSSHTSFFDPTNESDDESEPEPPPSQPADVRKTAVIKELIKVKGVGAVTAQKLYDQGIHSIEDVSTMRITEAIRKCFTKGKKAAEGARDDARRFLNLQKKA